MKDRLKSLFGLLVILAVAPNLIAIEIGEASEPIVIGIVHSEKFPFATMMRDSFEMALEVINKEGGIKGRALELVYGDDQGNRRAGEKVIEDLVENKGVSMLVGGYSSSNTVYMARIAEKLDRPFLICTAADDRITQRGWINIFRLNPPASQYTAGLEDFFMKKIKPESLAIVYENSPYGTSAALRMMWFCREHGIDIRRIIPYHKERLQPEYYKRILVPLKVKGEPPDVIYMVSYLKDAIAVVKEIRELRINALLCGGAGGFTHPGFIVEAGHAADHVLTSTLWYQEMKYPGTKQFYNEYLKRYATRPDYHAAEAYSALLVAANALRRAKSLTPEAVRDALNKTDMKTPFGPVRFSSFGKFQRQNRLPTQVLEIIRGAFELVWPLNLATAAFVAPPGWRQAEGK